MSKFPLYSAVAFYVALNLTGCKIPKKDVEPSGGYKSPATYQVINNNQFISQGEKLEEMVDPIRYWSLNAAKWSDAGLKKK